MFKDCNTIIEVTKKARELKESGHSEVEVNRLATARKKELVNQVAPINKVLKREVPTFRLDRNGESHLSIEVVDVNRPVIEIVDDITIRL